MQTYRLICLQIDERLDSKLVMTRFRLPVHETVCPQLNAALFAPKIGRYSGFEWVEHVHIINGRAPTEKWSTGYV